MAEQERRIDAENYGARQADESDRVSRSVKVKPAFGLAWRFDQLDGKRRTSSAGNEDPATVGHVRRIFADYDAGHEPAATRESARSRRHPAAVPRAHWSALVGEHAARDPVRTALHRRSRSLSDRLLQGARRAARRQCAAASRASGRRARCRFRMAWRRPDRCRRSSRVFRSRLAGNRERATDFRTTRNPEVGILRRGLAYCGQCGNRLVVVTSRGVPSYRCEGRERTGCPSAVTIPVAVADDAVWDWLIGGAERRRPRSPASRRAASG